MNPELEFLLHYPCSACTHPLLTHYTIMRDDDFGDHLECYGRKEDGGFCDCDWGPLEYFGDANDAS